MNAISVEDRVKIQSHLAEIWKILYANGLEDLEHNRTPHSKQKERMSQLNITYNKSHEKLTNGFSINVSTHDSCWHEIMFESTKDEDDYRKRRDEAYEIWSERNDRKLKRQREIEEEHHVAYWYKHHMTPHWISGSSSIWHFEQDEEGSRTYVGPKPNDFVHWLYHGVDPNGKPFTESARIKYMRKYGLDKDYDLETGKQIKDYVEDSTKAAEGTVEDKLRNVKKYLEKKFESVDWKTEAIKMDVEPMNSVDTYLKTVREFIKQQEELDLHGIALYGINSERTRAHEEMLKEYGLDGYDAKSEAARDITKHFDFVGEYKMTNGKMKTVFYTEYESSLRLAYALEVIIKEFKDK